MPRPAIPTAQPTATGPPANIWRPPNLAEWLSEVQKARRWLVPGFLPADAIVLMSGHQKRAFKTWLAFELALNVATGRAHPLLKPADIGPVLVIEEEGTKAETRSRMLALCKSKQISWKRIKNVLFAHRHRVRLDDEGWRERLRSIMQSERPLLVVLDALYLLHSGDENRVSDMAPVLDTLHMMRSEGATVMLLAHLDKQRGESRRADIDHQVRGSTVLGNVYDVHLALRRYRMEDPTIDLIIRSRDAEEKRYTVGWELVKKGDRLDSASLSITEYAEGRERFRRCAARLESGQDYILKDLRELWDLGLNATRATKDMCLEEGVLVGAGKNQWSCVLVPTSEKT